jgi:thioredoxin domain-containing protein 10
MMIVPLPSLIVINSTTNHHYIPEDEPEKLTPHVIELFLEQIQSESVPVMFFFLFSFKSKY